MKWKRFYLKRNFMTIDKNVTGKNLKAKIFLPEKKENKFCGDKWR